MPRRSARSRTQSTTSTSTARPDPVDRRPGRRTATASVAAATDSSARRLAEHLDLPYRDLSRLGEALTHSSYANEHPELGLSHNERLEFLGDAVLSLIVSESLMKRHPDEHEGQLTTRRAAIVSASGLARIASRLDLGSYLVLGEGASRSGERKRDSVLASLFEAVVAATFLDCGMTRTRRFVLQAIKPELEAAGGATSLKAPKSRPKEHASRRPAPPPTYRVVSAEGPDHRRHYIVEVS